MWKFLHSEMLVILALTENADRTDAEIADICGLKKGTVSSIRRRLLDAGAIYYACVPSFGRLGCEMLAFHYGTTDPAVRHDTKANHYMEFCNESPQIFHALIGGSSVCFFTALKNATDLESFVQHHNAFFSGTRRPSKAKLSSVIFPFSLSKITAAPQYAGIVHSYFQLDVPMPKNVPMSAVRYDPAELSSIEKKTLSTIVSNPSATDRQVASTVKLSRQGVTRIRNKLVEEELLRNICIPRLYRWGFEIYAVAHPRFRLEVGWDKRIRSQPKDIMERSFYVLSKADESVGNFMVPKFTEYSEKLENVLAWYHKVKAFEDPPELIVFSLDRSTELRNFDFAPAVSRLLAPQKE